MSMTCADFSTSNPHRSPRVDEPPISLMHRLVRNEHDINEFQSGELLALNA